MRPRIAVVGSLNTDLVIRAPALPHPGETVTGGEFATFPGGKGANQAVAAARLGAQLALIGCVGGDDFGRGLIDGLRQDGVDVSHVHVASGAASGTALITVGPQGLNTIVVAPGANLQLRPEDVAGAEGVIGESAVLLVQLEIPLDTVLAAARLASRRGTRVLLDPAPIPSQPLPAGLYQLTDVIMPNEREATALTGIAITDERSAAEAASHLVRAGVHAAVIKLGKRGAFVHDGRRTKAVPGIVVDAIDATGAGDAFAGALAVALAEGRDLIEAAFFANAAGALATTRPGAQPSMPHRTEVDALLTARRTAP
jgi:ribokinase